MLDNGKLVQAGPHDELLVSGGRYADLYRTQADAYTGAEQGQDAPAR